MLRLLRNQLIDGKLSGLDVIGCARRAFLACHILYASTRVGNATLGYKILPSECQIQSQHAHRTTSRNGLKHFRHFSMLKLTRHGHPTYLVPVVRFHSLSLRCTIYTTSKYTPLYPEQYAPHVDLYLPVFYIRDNPLAGPTGVT